MSSNSCAVVVLAAGQSTRFRPGPNKLVFPLLGRSVLAWVLHRVAAMEPAHLCVVLAPDRELPSDVPSDLRARCTPVVQPRPRGTGDAVLRCVEALNGYHGPLLVINGDTPAVRSETLRSLWAYHRDHPADLTLTVGRLRDPAGYGRILRHDDRIVAIVEAVDASSAEPVPWVEVNLGVYVMNWPSVLEPLRQLQPHPRKKEVFLTDLVAALGQQGGRVQGFLLDPPDEAFGINTWTEMHMVQEVLRRQIVADWMARGVHFLNPDRVWIEASVTLADGVVIYPDVVLEGVTRVGPGTCLYPGVRMRDTTVGEACQIFDHTLCEEAVIGDRCRVGPMARLRPGTRLADEVRIGNYVEVKNSTLGTGTKAMHLTYLGDATVGAHVNVGAGTITCNYDGIQKARTVIEDGAFIGSGTQLVAPVRIGRNAYVAAGSTVTEDVPPESLAIARGRQVNKPGWVTRRRQKKAGTDNDQRKAPAAVPSNPET